jgi:ribosomal-protein-alanine N-acetyltransferase
MLESGYLIRKMTSQDIDQVMEIERESFPIPWSKASYIGELRNSFASYVVCDCEGKVAGYGGIWVVFEEAHITNVAVGKKYRQGGKGARIMQELEAIARSKKATRILLEVRPSNTPAIKMYEKLGFVSTGRREKYYADNNEDAIVMTKYLV